jgi:hypothetical protein
MKNKQIKRNQMPDNPRPSVAGYTHSGHEAHLVNEKNNQDETKTEYNTGLSMRVRFKDNERQRKSKNNVGIRPNRNQTNGSGRHQSFLPLFLPPGGGCQAHDNLHP